MTYFLQVGPTSEGSINQNSAEPETLSNIYCSASCQLSLVTAASVSLDQTGSLLWEGSAVHTSSRPE